MPPDLAGDALLADAAPPSGLATLTFDTSHAGPLGTDWPGQGPGN
jgi:hypothetical protein